MIEMIVRNVTLSDLKRASNDVGVMLKGIECGGRITTWHFRLGLASEKWRRLSPTGRRIGAVCYHGHLAFMRRLYHYAPTAVIRTNMPNMNGGPTVYHSRTELEETKSNTAQANIGSDYRPLKYNHACACQRKKSDA